MNKYSKQVKVIERNINISNEEKIELLSSMLADFENSKSAIEDDYRKNFAERENKKSRFYWWQMVVTVISGIKTMGLATKTLESADISTLNAVALAVFGTITAAGIGSMVTEEFGLPIFKDEREAKRAQKMQQACEEIKVVLEKMLNNTKEKEL